MRAESSNIYNLQTSASSFFFTRRYKYYSYRNIKTMLIVFLDWDSQSMNT